MTRGQASGEHPLLRPFAGRDGVLVIDKPPGITSSQVVQRVRRWLQIDKVGHTGTLDPMATGVLPLCFGRATALAQFFTGQEKQYAATLRLGSQTDSGDLEGKITAEGPVPVTLEPDRIEAVLETLRGEQLQIPPMVSALKVGGQRLYDLARQGLTVERAARPVVIRRLTCEGYRGGELRFTVVCSKGTYVRVLGEAIAAGLETVGHLTALRRERSGRLDLAQAVALDDLERVESRAALLEAHWISMESAVLEWEHLELTEPETRGLGYGQKPKRSFPGPVGPLALVDPTGKLLALGERLPSGEVALTRVLIAQA